MLSECPMVPISAVIFKFVLRPVYIICAFLWLIGYKWTFAFFFIIMGLALTWFSSIIPLRSIELYLPDLFLGTVR